MINIDPAVSIYLDMYTWGLKRVPIQDIENACAHVGKAIRQKDYDNYWRGYYKSANRSRDEAEGFFSLSAYVEPKGKLDYALSEFPEHPYLGLPEIEERWVPCNQRNKPMIYWGQGAMGLVDAKAWPQSVYVAENLRHTRFVVIDCDGDHDENRLDLETILFLSRFLHQTHGMVKPKLVWEYDGYAPTEIPYPASFHLTFLTDRVIPTIHCPEAHIDILGNKENQLRYYKTKAWNTLKPVMLTEDIWHSITSYCKMRKESHGKFVGSHLRSQ